MPTLADQIISDAQEVYARNPDLFKDLTGKRVLITGGTGLLGLHMLAVLGIVDKQFGLSTLFYTSVQDFGFPNRIIRVAAPNAVWMQKNLAERYGTDGLPFADVIIHAAGYGQPTKFMADQIATLRLNTSVALDLDHYLASGGRALYISSSEIYSGNTWTPHTEYMHGTTTPQHPRAAYIEGKRCEEAIAAAQNKNEKTYKVARVSLSYGPGTRRNDDRVIYQFIGQALTSGVIQPKDAGQAMRTYNYVSDAVEMLFNILLRGKQQVYNVGGTSLVSIRDLATLIALITDTHAMFPENTAQADVSAPQAVRSSIDRYIAEFGKTDFVDIKEGLKRTIEWQKLLYA
jgi:UDP-glucuronate decarboxylase